MIFYSNLKHISIVQEQEVGAVAEVDEGGPRLNQHHSMLGVVMNI